MVMLNVLVVACIYTFIYVDIPVYIELIYTLDMINIEFIYADLAALKLVSK